MELPERRIYTVSELTEQIKDLLEGGYPSVWIQGEISNFRIAPSGHFYFTLSDSSSQIRCVMFKTQNRFLKFRPEEGLEIIAWGRLSVYAARGEYQLILDTMEPRGIGSLMLAFEQLRDRLASEGLFDESRKKPLPPFPKTIGLVTSPKGAAVRDMIRISSRRFPGINILLSPTLVQGDRAPEEIVAAVERISRAPGVDVIIIGRGGGSIEDLWAFNDERVVRAVAACPVPIVSAVGHETDFTLADFAADLRASTPSAAAELVVPSRRELMDRVMHLTARLRASISNRLDQCVRTTNDTLKRLYDPRRKIQERRQRLDELTTRLTFVMGRRLEGLRQETSGIWQRLRPEYLLKKTSEARDERNALVDRLGRSWHDRIKQARNSVETLAARLEGLSPLAILSRGYSITLRAEPPAVIKDADTVRTGEQVKVRLHRGQLQCLVTSKEDGLGRDTERQPE